MMKKLLFVISIFFVFVKVYALNIEVSNPIIRFSKEDDYVLQGFTNIDNKLFTVFIEPTEKKPKIKIFNLDNGKLIKEFIAEDVGHANDVTYNSKTNQIYVVNGNGKKIVHIFDADTYKKTTINISLPIRSLTYIDDKDLYAVRTVSTGFYLNNDFTLKSKVPFIMGMNFSSDIGRQGWTYYDGLIFYTTWSWLRYGGDGTNTIYVYTIGGDRVDRIDTSSSVGELEDIAFYNEKMVLGFNTYDDFIEFYLLDVPEINRNVINNETEENKENKEDNKDNMNKKIVFALIKISLVIVLLVLFFNRKRCK